MIKGKSVSYYKCSTCDKGEIGLSVNHRGLVTLGLAKLATQSKRVDFSLHSTKILHRELAYRLDVFTVLWVADRTRFLQFSEICNTVELDSQSPPASPPSPHEQKLDSQWWHHSHPAFLKLALWSPSSTYRFSLPELTEGPLWVEWVSAPLRTLSSLLTTSPSFPLLLYRQMICLHPKHLGKHRRAKQPGRMNIGAIAALDLQTFLQI